MSTAQKARNKDEEAEIRDSQQVDIVSAEYQKLLANAETARDHAAHKHFQIGFENRNSKVVQALKRLKGETKNAAFEEFNDVADCAPITKFAADFKKAVDDKATYCADIKFDCDQLEEFCIGHMIFKDSAKMTKTARFVNKTGLVEMKKLS